MHWYFPFVFPATVSTTGNLQALAYMLVPAVVLVGFLVRGALGAAAAGRRAESEALLAVHRQIAGELARMNEGLDAVRQSSEAGSKAIVAALEQLALETVEVEAPAPAAARAAKKVEAPAPAAPAPAPAPVTAAPAQKEAAPAPPEAAPETPAAPATLGGDALAEARALLAGPEINYPHNLLRARELLLPEKDGAHGVAVMTLLSETLFWLGELACSKEEQEAYHGEGVTYGKASVAADDSAAAHLWYAANMGAHGMARGIMSSLFYLGDIEKHGSRALALDERFFHAAPLRLMGRFYHQCPGWPVGKGDMNKAVSMLERATSLAPEFLMNPYFLADVYLAKRKKREARKVLEDMLAVDTYALMPDYMKDIQARGRKLLAKC